MTYQELKDRLSKCEYTLNCIKDGTLKDTNQKTVKKLEILKESLENQLKEQEAGMVVTRDSEEAEKLAKKGVNVNLKTEGPYQTTYIKVAKSDYKKAISILDSNIDPTYAKMDVVDDDGDDNVIIYFNFRTRDGGEPGEDVEAFIYDAAMDLKAQGVNVTGSSHDLDETKDINDPVLMKLRALKTKIGRKKGIVKGGERHTGKKIAILSKLQTKRDQVMRDMEQEAEPEGGPIADKYGDMLNKIDAAIAKAKGTKPKSYDDAIKEKKRPGLWANIRAKRARGEKPAHKNSNAHKDAVKAGKKINKLKEGQDEVFALGYDLDAIQYVIDYLKSKYKEGQDYELHIGRGDTHPNAITLKNPAMEQDEELGNLLMNAGDNEETDYQADRETYKDYAEENVDKVAGGIPYRQHGNKVIISEPLDDATKERLIQKAEEHGYFAQPNMAGGITITLKKGMYEEENVKLDKQHLSILASKAGKAVVKAVHDSGDEVARAKIKDAYASPLSGDSSPEAFTVHIIYKNDSEVSYRFQIINSALYLLADNEDIKISDIGFKPSGEPFINTELVRNEMTKYFKQMREMNDQEFADAKEADRLANHPEKDKILAIQQLIAKEKGLKEDDIAEEYTKEKLLAYLGQADDAMIRTYDDKYLIIYNPKNGNDDNAAMWHDDTVFGVDQDGQEHEVRYSQIDGLQLEQMKENSELDKITKAKRLIKQQAPAMNKLPQDDPKRKAFIDKVKQINQKHKELLDKEDNKVSGIGRNQELDEGRGDFDDVLKAIENMANNDDISERDAAAEIVLALADKFQLPVDKNLEDYMEEGESDLYEGTDLHIDKDFQFTRTNSGIQITERYSGSGPNSRYIHVPGRLLKRFIAGLAKSSKVFKDTKYQGQDAEDALQEVKVGDTLTKDGKKGKVTKISDTQATVDFGNGDVYGIAHSRIKGSEIVKEAGPGFAHDCAAKVVHEKYGKGNCIPEKHTLVKEGKKYVVTHYDVLFESGTTVKDIPVSELEIKTSNEHWHKGYKKKKK